MTAQVLPETAREVRELIRCGQWRGRHVGRGAGARAGQPGDSAQGPGLRLPAVLPAQSQAVPVAGGAGAGADRAQVDRARSGHTHRPAGIPGVRKRRVHRAGGVAGGLLAGRPGVLPAGLQLFFRDRHGRGWNSPAAPGQAVQRFHVHHQASRLLRRGCSRGPWW